jgi:hypothetical protein
MLVEERVSHRGLGGHGFSPLPSSVVSVCSVRGRSDDEQGDAEVIAMAGQELTADGGSTSRRQGQRRGAGEEALVSGPPLLPPFFCQLMLGGTSKDLCLFASVDDASPWWAPTGDSLGTMDASFVPFHCGFVGTRSAFVPTAAAFVRTDEAFVSTDGAFVSTDGAFVSTDGAFVSTDGAFVSTDGAFVSTDGAFVSTDEAFVSTDGAFVSTDGAFVSTDGAFVRTDEAFVSTDEAFVRTD